MQQSSITSSSTANLSAALRDRSPTPKISPQSRSDYQSLLRSLGFESSELFVKLNNLSSGTSARKSIAPENFHESKRFLDPGLVIAEFVHQTRIYETLGDGYNGTAMPVAVLEYGSETVGYTMRLVEGKNLYCLFRSGEPTVFEEQFADHVVGALSQ